jgi:hypothetical protein
LGEGARTSRVVAGILIVEHIGLLLVLLFYNTESV